MCLFLAPLILKIIMEVQPDIMFLRNAALKNNFLSFSKKEVVSHLSLYFAHLHNPRAYAKT